MPDKETIAIVLIAGSILLAPFVGPGTGRYGGYEDEDIDNITEEIVARDGHAEKECDPECPADDPPEGLSRYLY